MNKVALLLITLLAVNCGGHYKHEMPQPTQERIQELMRLTKPPVVYNGKFEVIVYPRFVFERSAIRVRCLVPSDKQDGRDMRFGIENKEMSEQVADRYEYIRTYENMECGPWKASCTLSTGERREQEFTVFGSCNQDDRDP